MRIQEAANMDVVFGQTVALLRARYLIDQEDLAQKLGILRPALSRLERGESPANISMITKIAGAFRIEPSSLIREYETALKKLEQNHIQVGSKKELSKENNGLAFALLGAAAIALLISK